VSYSSGTTTELREDDTASNIMAVTTDDNRSMASTMNRKPEVVQTRSESSISSGRVSSISGTIAPDDNVALATYQNTACNIVGHNNGAVIPTHPPISSESSLVPNNNIGAIQPYYNMQSNNIQRIFFSIRQRLVCYHQRAIYLVT
jgi:hypothetical protein